MVLMFRCSTEHFFHFNLFFYMAGGGLQDHSLG